MHVNGALKHFSTVNTDGGQFVLTAYMSTPSVGYDFLATAAHSVGGPSAGTHVKVGATAYLRMAIVAFIHRLGPANGEVRISQHTDRAPRPHYCRRPHSV